jgi:hypothetical protein
MLIISKAPEMQTVVGNVICCLRSHQSMILFSKSEIWSQVAGLMKGKGKARDAIYPQQSVETGYAFMNRNAKGALRPQQCAESGYTFMKGKGKGKDTPPRSKRTSLRHFVSGSNVLKQYICWLNEQKSSHVDNEC